jgi:hypothetical protein
LKSYIRRASQIFHASSKAFSARLLEQLAIPKKDPLMEEEVQKILSHLDDFSGVLASA